MIRVSAAPCLSFTEAPTMVLSRYANNVPISVDFGRENLC